MAGNLLEVGLNASIHKGENITFVGLYPQFKLILFESVIKAINI